MPFTFSCLSLLEIFGMAESPDAKRTKLSHGADDPERTPNEAEDVVKSYSPIEQLPRELMWKVIEYAPQTVNNMRLVS